MYHHGTPVIAGIALAFSTFLCLAAQDNSDPFQGIVARMKPYDGKHNPGVDASTLTGKVMCGYQGWFAAEGDGSGRGWVHFGRGNRFSPKECTIDLWPDMTEMDSDEKYATPFKHKDGSTAYIFSSYNRKTVLRHFRWMREHGIDGVFLQRFGNSVKHPNATYEHRNVVTANVQAGANLYGRTWAMMYDLSGLQAGDIEKVVIEDWKRLVDHMKITDDKAYLHHRGKPVVAVWGVGFSGDRKYTLDECEKLVKFLKDAEAYGGNTVMLGVPANWRALNRDALHNEDLHKIMRQADIISPWTVGRYNSPGGAREHAESHIKGDIKWAKDHDLDYLPVIFPGFSWQNLQKSHGRNTKINQIPRIKGQFLWSQACAFKKAGAEMFYVAMFDEVDEGTAIFKCSNNPPVGESRFVTYEGLPSDHYLWLAGRVGALLRDEVPATEEMPDRKEAKVTALFTQTGTDPTFKSLMDNDVLPIGKNSTKGVTGSTIDVNNDLIRQVTNNTNPIPESIRIHTLCNSLIPRKDFKKWTRWYQEDGNTQVFRLFEGEHNVRNQRKNAARVEAFSNIGWQKGPWHEWEGTYTIIKPHGCAIFQAKNNENDWSVMINMSDDGDIKLNHRRHQEDKIMARNMTGKSFDLKVRDNGRDYEVYLNGKKEGAGYYDRPEGHTNFRWGMYVGGKTLVKHDAMIFVTGAKFK